ncbi:MAG TPA: APC family permease, partial [Solirubrobacteraceae bacterium]|nr:APC family permease [Solirubrobacteraceae bacterium]
WICWRGIELSAAIQRALLSFEVLILGVFAVVALVKVYGGSAGHTAIKPTADWFNPFAMNFGDLLDAILLGVFIYWGWDSGVAVNEESEDPANGPGKAAVIATLLLLVIYLLVATGAQAFHGVGFLTNEANAEDVLNALGKPVFGGGAVGWILAKALVVCVLTSASASTQTTILPTARTTLSMAHWKAVHRVLGRVHKTYLTPDVSTIAMGVLSIIVTVPLLLLSESVLADSITALGFPVCFYYGFTGLACTWYYRRELTKSAKHFFGLGVAPFLGGVIMLGVLFKAADFYGKAENVESKPILGITLPLWFGIGGMVLGVIVMLISRPYFKEFFARKTETARPGVLEEPPMQTMPPAVDF